MKYEIEGKLRRKLTNQTHSWAGVGITLLIKYVALLHLDVGISITFVNRAAMFHRDLCMEFNPS